MISKIHKSKEKEENVLKANILGFLVLYLAEACSLYGRGGWQFLLRQPIESSQNISQALIERRQISRVLTPKNEVHIYCEFQKPFVLIHGQIPRS